MAITLLSGCTDNRADSTPVAWWHQIEGGRIAQDRPPPPDATAPWPRIGSVPARPDPGSAAYRDALASRLSAERDVAERNAASAPLVAPTLPPAPRPQAPNATDTTSSASLDTPEDKPAPPPARVQTRAQTEPQATPAVSAGTPVALRPSADAAPDLAGPPAPPAFLGVAAVPPPTAVAFSAPSAPAGTDVLFAPGAADFLLSQMPTLKAMVARRGRGHIAVIGLGEAKADTTQGQAVALKLALSRAASVADHLHAMGVPRDHLRLSAYAFGRGARLALLP